MMGKIALIAALLLFALSLVSADVGPGPSPVGVMVKVVKNGAPYTGAVEMTYLCSDAAERHTDPKNAVDPYDMQMTCSDGSCTRPQYYKFNPCFYSKGKFELKADGKNVTSQEVSLETSGGHNFEMDVATGALTTGGNLIPEPGPEPSPTPSNWCCLPTFGLVLLPALAMARKGM
jgi:hypothetical protein